MPGQILQLHLPAANSTKAWQSRHVKGYNPRLRRNHGTYTKGFHNDGINLCFRSSPISPRLQANEHGTSTGFVAEGHDVKARNTHDTVNTLYLQQGRYQLVDNLRRLVQGSSLRQVYCYSIVALILIRHEGGRHNLVQEPCQAADNHHKHQGNLDVANKPAHHALIAEAHSVKGLVEFIKEPSQYALIFILLMRLQDSGTESRCQCQCHKSRQGHGNSDGQGKLAIQNTHHAPQECHRHKYCRQHEGNSHNRALYLVHGPLSSVHRIQALLHVRLNVLDNNDRIIYYQADCQHHGKQGQGVDGEPQESKGNKCTYQRYRHCQKRNEGCPPVLQENKYYQHNQHQCLDKCMHNLIDRGTDKLGAVYNLLDFQIRREVLLGILQDFLYFRYSSHSVGITGELDTEAHCIHAVVARYEVIVLSTSFYPGNILDAHILSVSGSLQDDVAKLLGTGQTAINLAGGLLFLTVSHRRGTYRTCRSLHVLLIDGCHDVSSRNIHLCHLGRVHPDAHGMVSTKHHYVTYAVYALDLIQQINIRIVLHPRAVIGLVRGIHCHHQCHIIG